jgi:hypothetical protein
MCVQMAVCTWPNCLVEPRSLVYLQYTANSICTTLQMALRTHHQVHQYCPFTLGPIGRHGPICVCPVCSVCFVSTPLLSQPPHPTHHTPARVLCRYLVEAPPNVCTPQHLAAAAADIAAKSPQHFSLEVRGQHRAQAYCMQGSPACVFLLLSRACFHVLLVTGRLVHGGKSDSVQQQQGLLAMCLLQSAGVR